MAVRVGLFLSVAVVAAAIVFAYSDGDVAPELRWVNDVVALFGAVSALAGIWLGVIIARVIARLRHRQSERLRTSASSGRTRPSPPA